MTKHSKQRDAIFENLRSRKDHPTAEEIYLSLKPAMPAISLATVYRNLAQLENEGLILRLGSGGSARYDGDTDPHYHLLCLGCGRVFDIPYIDDGGLCEKAGKLFDGEVLSTVVTFRGYCVRCTETYKS